MKINADFAQRILIHSDEVEWRASPMPGVSRRPLDRIGDEVARATTIVRYDPGSHFAAHTHDGGEEFIVLDGVFQDEHGDFPAGSYIRNPPTSRHTPGSEAGATIFVKLWQFSPEDRTHVRVDINRIGGIAPAGRPGVEVAPLFRDGRETVQIETWEPATSGHIEAPGGAELLMLEGSATENSDALRQHSWLRVPVGGGIDLTAGPDGARFWLKTGHLRHVTAPDPV